MVKSSPFVRIRILSLLAVLVFVVIVVTAGLLIVTNPGLTLLYLVSIGGMVGGGWLLLSSRDKRFWAGLMIEALAILALVAVTLAFFSDKQNRWRLILLIGSSLLYLGLTGYISKLYWQHQREERQIAVLPYKHPVLLINPKSGDGRALKANIPDLAQAAGIETIMLQPAENMSQLLEAAVRDGADVIGISGGDGSLGLAAKIAIDHDLPLVVLPGGTRCHFARDIGLDPKRIADALNGFWGVERRVDVGQIGDRFFLNNASFGLYADITNHPAYRSHKIETSRQVMHDLASSDTPYYPLVFQDGKGITWSHAALVVVGVNRYETLHIGEVGTRKRLDEGVLQVIAVPALNDTLVKGLLKRKRLDTLGDAIADWTTSSFTIAHLSGRIQLGLDGETVEMAAPVNIRIRPLALRLLVPAEGVRGRGTKPFSAKATKTLLHLISGKVEPAEKNS